MAAPTEAEAIIQLQNTVHVIEEIREFGETDATNLLGVLDVAEQSLEGDYSAAIASALSGIRATYAANLTPATIRSLLTPVLRHWARAANIEPRLSPEKILDLLHDRMVDTTAARVSSRQFVFGAAVAGGANVGNGTILRATVDRDNFQIQNTFAEVLTFLCDRDMNTGTEEHEEEFEVRGDDSARDAIELLGSGVLGRLKCRSARDSMLRNASLDSFSGTAAVPTAITSWAVDVIGNVQIDQVNFYRGFPGDATPASLRLNTNVQVSQALEVARIQQFDPKRPYMLQLAFNRAVGGGDGTLTIRLGSRNIAVVLAAQAGWNILRVAIDQNSWPETFNEDALDIRIELTLRTVGYTLVDDVLLLPFDRIAGKWLLGVGGATNFLQADRFTITDTEAATGIVQRILWRGFDKYLPHAVGGAITIADP